MGYTDALTLGKSVGAVANVLELNALDREDSRRCIHPHVLRERIHRKLWEIEHGPGKELCCDL